VFDSGLEMGAAMTEKVEFERKQIPISLTDYESAQESKREREGEKSHFQFHCHMKGAQKDGQRTTCFAFPTLASLHL